MAPVGSKKGPDLFSIIFTIIGFLILAAFLWILYESGYRFSSEAAARATPSVDQSSTLFDTVKYSWADVYLFDTKDGPRTVLTVKDGPVWHAPISVYEKQHTDDAVQAVGWMSYGDSQHQRYVTVFAALTTDNRVAYIEAGPANNRLRKSAQAGKTIVFSWDKPLNSMDLKPLAYDHKGQPLYEYGYPKGTTVFKAEDMRWYPVAQVSTGKSQK